MRIEELTVACEWGVMVPGRHQACRSGQVRDYTSAVPFYTGENCPACHGTGQVLTVAGREIVQLVRTWGPLLAAQEAEVA